MKHRHVMRLLCSLLLFALFASFGVQPLSSAESASIQISLGTPTAPEEVQRKLILNNYNNWAVRDSGSSPWFYAITDLDHNGRLEVITAYLQGTGLHTTGKVWEVSSDFASVAACRSVINGGDNWPDLIQDSFVAYFDKGSNSYNYVFETVTRQSPSRYLYAWRTLCLTAQNVAVDQLGTKSVDYVSVNSSPTVTCTNRYGQAIPETQYNSLPEQQSANCELSVTAVTWVPVETAPAAKGCTEVRFICREGRSYDLRLKKI